MKKTFFFLHSFKQKLFIMFQSKTEHIYPESEYMDVWSNHCWLLLSPTDSMCEGEAILSKNASVKLALKQTLGGKKVFIQIVVIYGSLHRPSIHPSIHCQSWRQQFQQGAPDSPFLGHIGQL